MKHRSMNKKLILTFAAMLVVAAISVPGTLAYFSDYDQAAGAAPVTLTWQTEVKEQVKDNNKHIQVENVGETDVIVRVQVFGGDFVSVSDAGGSWTRSGDWWYYDRILKKGETTPELLAEVRTAAAPEEDFNVIVVHESSRAVYEDNTRLLAPDGWAAAAMGAIQVQ